MNLVISNQKWLVVLLLNFLLFVFYTDTVLQLFEFWSESYGYSHGLLLFPMALSVYFFEIYKKPKLDFTYLNQSSYLILFLMILIWILSNIMSIQVIEFVIFFSLLFVLNFIITTDNFKQVNHLWPLLLILFILPVWDSLSEFLRLIETPIVVLALKASFIETIQDGFLIYVPAGTFLVENSCSGFNQFIVSIPLAAFYLYSRKISLAKGYKFILLLLLLAMIFNILRIYIIVVAGQITHMKSPLINDHEYLAWLIYGIGVFILFYLSDRLWVNKLKENNQIESPKDVKQVENKKELDFGIKIKKGKVIFLLIVLISGPVLAYSYSKFQDDRLLDINLLEESLYWKDTDKPVTFKPDFNQGNVAFSKRLFNLTGQTVNLTINFFIKQEQGHEAVSDLYGIVNKDKGTTFNSKRFVVKISESVKIFVNEKLIRLKTGEQFVTWQWYFTNGMHLTNNREARYNNLIGIFKNNPQISNIVISKRVTRNLSDARKNLRLFLVENNEILQQVL